MIKLYKYLPVILINLLSYSANSQSLDGVYGIYRTSTTYYFAKLDQATGNLLLLQQTPFGYGSIENQSTFINPDDSILYFSNGHNIAGLDLKNNTLVLDTSFNIPATDRFINILYNTCDSNLYGMHYNASVQGCFAKYDLSTHTFSDLGPYTITGIVFGTGYSIDIQNQLYVANIGPVKGYDINTGQNIFNTTIVNLPGESFRHLAYNCMDTTFYGTSVNTTAGTKYLAKINPYTGVVSHVSNINNLNTYFWKNAYAMFTVDPFNGLYYYISGVLVGVDVNTGAVAATQSINLGGGNNSFDYITYFTQCRCDFNTPITELVHVAEQITVSPNPANDFLSIQYNLYSPNQITLSLFNLYGQKLKAILSEKQPAGEHEIKIDMNEFPAGIYYVILNAEGKEVVRKVVKY